jgi:hypothetical protein
MLAVGRLIGWIFTSGVEWAEKAQDVEWRGAASAFGRFSNSPRQQEVKLRTNKEPL